MPEVTELERLGERYITLLQLAIDSKDKPLPPYQPEQALAKWSWQLLRTRIDRAHCSWIEDYLLDLLSVHPTHQSPDINSILTSTADLGGAFDEFLYARRNTGIDRVIKCQDSEFRNWFDASYDPKPDPNQTYLPWQQAEFYAATGISDQFPRINNIITPVERIDLLLAKEIVIQWVTNGRARLREMFQPLINLDWRLKPEFAPFFITILLLQAERALIANKDLDSKALVELIRTAINLDGFEPQYRNRVCFLNLQSIEWITAVLPFVLQKVKDSAARASLER